MRFDPSPLENSKTIENGFNLLNNELRLAMEYVAEQLGEYFHHQLETEYNRPIGGKGFTNRKEQLRPSINLTITNENGETTLHGETDIPYAAYVETVTNGKFAYMEPALNDTMVLAPGIIERIVKPIITEKAKKVASRVGRLRKQLKYNAETNSWS